MEATTAGAKVVLSFVPVDYENIHVLIPVCSLTLHFICDKSGSPKEILIHYLGTNEKHQKKGFASLMIASTLLFAETVGVDEVFVHNESDYPEIYSLFTHNGKSINENYCDYGKRFQKRNY